MSTPPRLTFKCSLCSYDELYYPGTNVAVDDDGQKVCSICLHCTVIPRHLKALHPDAEISDHEEMRTVMLEARKKTQQKLAEYDASRSQASTTTTTTTTTATSSTTTSN